MPCVCKVPDQVADSIAKFFDRQIKPPRGGWHFPLPGGNTLERHSEADVLSELKRWRKNNGTFVSDVDLERELWTYYCNREPARCRQTTFDAQPKITALGVGPVEVTKEMQGPPIWTYLNTLAVQWTPGLHDYFLATVDAIPAILVCPICTEEWRRLLRNRPPQGLGTRLAVCQWINAVHNEVNMRVNKPAYPYSRMVTEYGAPIA